MTEVSYSLSIITLNIGGLNYKRDWQKGLKNDLIYSVYRRLTLDA